ncbi:hypothetical protein GW17_00045398 [Ensete ventricosum]|nr:hypothetical protein GW17_00045398 [Ensete ventricosum]
MHVETTTDSDHLRCELPRFTVIFDLEVGEMRIQSSGKTGRSSSIRMFRCHQGFQGEGAARNRCNHPEYVVMFQGGVAYPWLGDLIRLASVGGASLFVSASFHSPTGSLVVDACTKVMVMRGRCHPDSAPSTVKSTR